MVNKVNSTCLCDLHNVSFSIHEVDINIPTQVLKWIGPTHLVCLPVFISDKPDVHMHNNFM